MSAQRGPEEWLYDGPEAPARRRRSTPGRRLVTVGVLGLVGVAIWSLRVSETKDTGAAPTGPAAPAAPVSGTPAPRVAALEVSTRSVEVPRTSTIASFGIANTGDLPALYQVSTRTPWIDLTAIGGLLGGGSGRRVDLLVDRSAARSGTVTGKVFLSWDAGEVVVRVRLTTDEAVVSPPSPTREPSTHASR